MPRLFIIGNSAAGLAAVRSVRSRDPRLPITLIAAERHPPYSRIMLTYLLAGKTRLEHLPLEGPDWYDQMGVRALTGRRAAAIHTNRRQALTEDAAHGRRAERVPFDRLLIATDVGIVVDDTMATSVPGVFAAGDVAQATHCVTGRRVCYGTWTSACEWAA